MRYIEIAEHIQPLDEIEIIQNLAGSAGQAQRFLGGALIARESFGEVYQQAYPQHHQDVYYVGDQTEVFSYVVVEDRGGHAWLLEAYTEPQHRGKNLSPQLIQWAVRKLGRLIIDQQLTPTSARMVERMIDTSMVSASIVDTVGGTTTTYNPTDPVDQSKPMYDVDVPGINRPRLSQADKLRFTWMLESAPARRGVLSSYIRKL